MSEMRAKGVRIQPGAMITWDSGSAITCDALGAVALAHRIDSRGFPKGWLKSLCDILREDTWWVHRFCMGFDRRFQICIIDDEEKPPEIHRDDVSSLGIKLRKEFCPEWCK